MPRITNFRTGLRFTSVAALLGLAGWAVASGVATGGTGFTVTGSTFASGGGISSGGPFSVQGTTGQSNSGTDLSGGGFSVSSGFWEPVVSMQDPLCLGDCDNSGAVNFNDLVSMLFEFGNTAEDSACDCDESGEINFNDLVCALFVFGSCK